jgi:maltose O-acetyltransferase
MGKISFDPNVKIGFSQSPYFLNSSAYVEARNPGSNVHIGSGTWINNGFSCIAEHTSIAIGQNCRIGVHVEIADSNFHGLSVHERGLSKPQWAKPVVVEDDVFIGSNVRILKGVRIGAGAVIANSSVVARDVPAMTVVGGIPAKVIRTLT